MITLGPPGDYTVVMRDSLRHFFCLLMCVLLVIQGSAGAAMTFCQHPNAQGEAVTDAEGGDCPGHTQAMTADDTDAPAAVSDAGVADVVGTPPGCDCRLCLMAPQGARIDFSLPSPEGLAAVLHAAFLSIPGSSPTFPRRKPPRRPA